MTKPRDLPKVRAASKRVALAATLIVAAVYATVAAVVFTIVNHGLVSEVDRRLTASLVRIAGNPGPYRIPAFGVPAGGPRFGAPLLVWSFHSDGTVSANNVNIDLPAEFQRVSSPTTISIGGTDVRVVGGQLGNDYVVVGQTMDVVSQARSTLLLAELGVAPVLLGIVFLGALAIGRRVAGPIELARQRQMEFTADASHELRTPLSVIEAQASLALAQDREPAWYRGAFVRVHAESMRIRRLVEDLLWLARFDATRASPYAEPVDVGVLARQAVDRFATVAETRRLQVNVSVVGETHIVNAPPEWLDRLLGVLLDNACKYSNEGGRVEVRVGDDSGRVRLAVEDSGPGIPVEERSRIFDRFHRATQKAGGAGLGLAIADAVVKASDGRWDIGDSPFGGASMAVSWPRSIAASRSSPARLPTDAPGDEHRVAVGGRAQA
jgi:signal transduction histidine kinase